MRVYRFPELKPAGVPFTRKHVTTLEKRGQFPMHFNVGENSVAWLADEVDRWVDEKVRGRRSLAA
jgi:predicted DNA-binding transcriptional regulator AlpA